MNMEVMGATTAEFAAGCSVCFKFVKKSTARAWFHRPPEIFTAAGMADKKIPHEKVDVFLKEYVPDSVLRLSLEPPARPSIAPPGWRGD
jgi:hypothetical protein